MWLFSRLFGKRENIVFGWCGWCGEREVGGCDGSGCGGRKKGILMDVSGGQDTHSIILEPVSTLVMRSVIGKLSVQYIAMNIKEREKLAKISKKKETTVGN